MDNNLQKKAKKDMWEQTVDTVIGFCIVAMIIGMMAFATIIIVWIGLPQMAVDSKFLGLYALLFFIAGGILSGFLLWLKRKA